jgi:hypothetical protein
MSDAPRRPPTSADAPLRQRVAPTATDVPRCHAAAEECARFAPIYTMCCRFRLFALLMPALMAQHV